MLTGVVGIFIPTELSFSCLCAGKAADLSPSLSVEITFFSISHMHSHTTGWEASNTEFHTRSGCVFNAQGIHSNCNLDLRRQILSLPYCSKWGCPSRYHLFCSQADLRTLQFLTSWFPAISLQSVLSYFGGQTTAVISQDADPASTVSQLWGCHNLRAGAAGQLPTHQQIL